MSRPRRPRTSMSAQRQAPERRVDVDGVTRTAQPGVGAGRWILGTAAALTCACMLLGLWLTLSEPEAPASELFPSESPPLAQAEPAAVTPVPTVRRVPVAARVQAPASAQERMAR